MVSSNLARKMLDYGDEKCFIVQASPGYTFQYFYLQGRRMARANPFKLFGVNLQALVQDRSVSKLSTFY
jgi:hypothetical protein